jgi:hypothetical protein
VHSIRKKIYDQVGPGHYKEPVINIDSRYGINLVRAVKVCVICVTRAYLNGRSKKVSLASGCQ